VSVGHFNITAGTLDCRIQIASDPGGEYILSNNHVLADTNAGLKGDDIMEPGPYDGGTAPIARLEDFEPIQFLAPGVIPPPINQMDAAIAKVIKAGDVLPDIWKNRAYRQSARTRRSLSVCP